ncbi:Uncharacterised protein [Acinetobacter baumannii]|nr:Uncharacterised protein [Acinetobacter baumannii]
MEVRVKSLASFQLASTEVPPWNTVTCWSESKLTLRRWPSTSVAPAAAARCS